MSETIIKKRVNGKAKGNSFENTISKRFSKLLSPLEFKRSQSSGAVLGGLNEKHLDKYSHDIKTIFIGDVVPTNQSDVIKSHGWKFRFTIECKSYKSVETLQKILTNSIIFTWYEQALTDAKKLDKEALLIFKFNHTDIFVAIDSKINLPIDNLDIIMNLKNKFYDINIVKLVDLEKDIEWWKQYEC